MPQIFNGILSSKLDENLGGKFAEANLILLTGMNALILTGGVQNG
jgi:hypothetical protein